MCLILFAVQPNDQCQLLVAANRDEQHQRPSLKANFWLDDSQILGGRDIQANGTWLGISRSGRFAAVTNFAEAPQEPLPPRSRGDLCRDFLRGNDDCVTYLEAVHKQADQFRGFNLLLNDPSGVYYYSNRESEIKALEPGFYGLSNQLLNCHWPKVDSGRDRLKQSAVSNFNPQELFEILLCQGDDRPYSARFILGENYGTRASTVVKLSVDKIDFEERTFDNQANEISRSQFRLQRT